MRFQVTLIALVGMLACAPPTLAQPYERLAQQGNSKPWFTPKDTTPLGLRLNPSAQRAAYDRLRQPAYNRVTRTWGTRTGHDIIVSGLDIPGLNYLYVTVYSTDFDGGPYIELHGIGPLSFTGKDRLFHSIVMDLESQEPGENGRVNSALIQLEDMALEQHLVRMPRRDSD